MQQAGTQYTTQQMGSIYLASGTFGDWSIKFKNLIIYNYYYFNSRVNDHVSNKAIPLTVELPPNDNQVNSFIDGFMIKPDKVPVVYVTNRFIIINPIRNGLAPN